ncbi:alpha/beta-tubulin-N-acetyltransferase 9 isoform X3 [Dendrobates tinctorius]|uniref:alpha/beta-tubulin-N-acetyltransferase 9 isoform X3 n=1 Tax=Dendrobates tinctorius TaxID=92724 RepID=UPI003CC93CFB
MRVNEDTVLRGHRVLLVPYDPHHVPRYHEWMKSEELQKLTASEPLTLDQEYDMQRSWREDSDKHKSRRRGFGEESVQLMLYYGATTLGISTYQAKIGEENVTSIRLFNRLHFSTVSYSSIFQEMTLHWEVSETERQWLLDSLHFTVESYRATKQNRETDVHR